MIKFIDELQEKAWLRNLVKTEMDKFPADKIQKFDRAGNPLGSSEQKPEAPSAPMLNKKQRFNYANKFGKEFKSTIFNPTSKSLIFK
jgi:hypothetical protein